MNITPRNVTLQDLNDQRTQLLIPAMVYVGVAMVLGLLGNSLVVYVFPLKLTSGTQNILITSLAVFDLLSCLIAMPTEIIDMRYFYMFESEFACKMFRFVNAFCAMCSILTLLTIAVDRYRKVCRPHQRQLGVKQVKIAVAIAIVVAAMFACPAVVLYGIRSAETEIEGLIGKDCSTSDAVKTTIYPLLYNGVLAFLFVLITVILCVLYFLVWKTARRHVVGSRPPKPGENRTSAISTIELSSADSEGSSPSKKEYNLNNNKTTRRKRNKTTTIAFLVTIVFILSFVPYLVLSITRALKKDFDYHLNSAGIVFFNLFIRSYFVNSAANPIIYGLMNIKFRSESNKVLKRLLCCSKP